MSYRALKFEHIWPCYDLDVRPFKVKFSLRIYIDPIQITCEHESILIIFSGDRNFWNFQKNLQWWEIGIFGIFRDFFRPDPIFRFTPNQIPHQPLWISIQEKNLEAITRKMRPVEGEQTNKTTKPQTNETSNILGILPSNNSRYVELHIKTSGRVLLNLKLPGPNTVRPTVLKLSHVEASTC